MFFLAQHLVASLLKLASVLVVVLVLRAIHFLFFVVHSVKRAFVWLTNSLLSLTVSYDVCRVHFTAWSQKCLFLSYRS